MDISKGIHISDRTPRPPGPVRSIADLNIPPVKFSDELEAECAKLSKQVREFMRTAEAIKKGTYHFDADNAPEKAVKNVMKDGQLVATIYRSGVVSITSAFSGQLRGRVDFSDSSDQSVIGRTEMIAKAIGGQIVDVKRPANGSSSGFSVMA